MKIKNLYELSLILKSKLKSGNWPFLSNGNPRFPKEIVLSKCPDSIEPLSRIRSCKNPGGTLLCSFLGDSSIERRLRVILDETPQYLKFAGVGGFDLSPRIRWPVRRQRFNLHLSQLATAFIAMNGQKILPNFRIGDVGTLDFLDSYPPNISFLVGSLGYSKRFNPVHAFLFKTKLLYARSSVLIIYGPLRKEYREILGNLNIPYKIVEDFRTKSFRESKSRRNA